MYIDIDRDINNTARKHSPIVKVKMHARIEEYEMQN